MDKVRIGIIGIGGMGSYHVRMLMNREVPGAELTAVCDIRPERLEWAKETIGEGVRLFDNTDALFASAPGLIDAVIIATPHYLHPPLAIQALQRGLHVEIEKPAGVYTKQVKEMNEVALKSNRVFGIMFNQRTNPLYQKVRELIKSGELGSLIRTNWIITDWFRTQSYYDGGGWRATWEGEGGGVLLNQGPHQLDLWQWMCGMPVKVRSFMGFGKYHDIEVEDDVTTYVEYENGATGIFVICTGETPGTNRLEVTGDLGKLVVEGTKLKFSRNRMSGRKFIDEFKGGWGVPECWDCDIPITGKETAHAGISTNWVQSILNGTPLIAPGVEGINGLTISNAMHLSVWTDSTIELPLDEDLYYEKLQEKIRTSENKKDATTGRTLDVAGSTKSIVK